MFERYNILSDEKVMEHRSPDFVDTELPSTITEFALLITSQRDGADRFASGTAVIISPFLALTARHVLDDHWERHEGGPMHHDGEGAGSFSLELFQIIGTTVNRWTVTRFWTIGASDFAALRLTPHSTGAESYQFKHLHLDLLPPRVGEWISAFGYSGPEIEEVAPKSFVIRQFAPTSHGQVLEVHVDRRDAARLNFPCFRTNARFDGSMSGGPVFNAKGHLCGLVCSNLPPLDEGEEHASYAVLLWPAMGLPIDLDRVGRPSGVRYPMIDLVRDGFILAENADTVAVGTLPPNGIAPVEISLPAWYTTSPPTGD